MARVQLALNVSDLTSAVEFYTKLFRAEPSKVRPGYANFVVEDPPLKLVLVEGAGAGGTVNHLGVEVPTTDDVTEATKTRSGNPLLLAEVVATFGLILVIFSLARSGRSAPPRRSQSRRT